MTVPADYVANTVTSFSEIMDASYPIDETIILINFPVVPEGSTVKLRLGGECPKLSKGWFKEMIVYYFNFLERAPMGDESDMVPRSPIYVAFNINPDLPGGGPASGFMTDPATGRTHNVVATLPMDEDYSPLWHVNVYANADWENIHDLESAMATNILATGVAHVNCPIVEIDNATPVEDESSTTPLTYSLDQNFPNPFNPSTEIQFSVASCGQVMLRVYNILGKQVAELMNENLQPGNYSVHQDARDQSSGLYFYTLEAGSYKVTKRMTHLK